MDSADTKENGKTEQTSIKEIKAIEKSRGENLAEKSRIKEYVESPLVKACERYWDMNVWTLSSSANSKDIGYEAYIIIDYDSLSEENKVTAKKAGEFLEHYDGRSAVKIKYPVDENTTAEEIEKKSVKTAEKFQKQQAIWIPSFSLQDMRRWYGMESDDNKYGVDAFEEQGFFYDSEEKKFYYSEEHFQKTKEVK